MKKVFLLLLLAISFSGWSQQRKERANRQTMEKMTPEERQEVRLQKMTKDLNLDAKQQEEVKKLMTEQNEKVQTIREERKQAKEKQLLASAKDRKTMTESLKKEKEANDAKMKKILTPEQYTKWENNRAIREEKMLQKREERRGQKYQNKEK